MGQAESHQGIDVPVRAAQDVPGVDPFSFVEIDGVSSTAGTALELDRVTSCSESRDPPGPQERNGEKLEAGTEQGQEKMEVMEEGRHAEKGSQVRVETEMKGVAEGPTSPSANSKLFSVVENEKRWPAEIEYKDLTFTVQLPRVNRDVVTIWSTVKSVAHLWDKSPRAEHKVLASVSGKLRSGSRTLLLGPPSSGKTTFLKALAGRLTSSTGCKVSGCILYDGIEQKHIETSRAVSFVEQLDYHLPLLAVRETLSFANEASGTAKFLKANTGLDLKTTTDEMLQALGLSNCAGTIVGNDFIRGVSGGERKRTSIGEMAFSRAPVVLLDEVTTGLDSSTAKRVIRLLAESAQNMRRTLVASLLQPSPDIIQLFDDVIVMAQGSILYHGKVEDAEAYFERLGYRNVPGRGLGEFLVDMGTTRRRQYGCGRKEIATASQVPSSELEGLANVWRVNGAFQASAASCKTEAAKDYVIPGAGRYNLDWWEDGRVILRRQLTAYWADRIILGAILLVALSTGLVAGLLFFDIPFAPESPGDPTWIRVRFAAIFFSLLHYVLSGFSLIPWTLLQRDVFYKQYAAGMCRPSGYVWSGFVTQFFTAVPEAILVVTSIFLLCRIVDLSAPDAAQVYFMLLLIAITFNLCINSIIKLVSFLCSSVIPAFLANTLVVSILLLYAGFIVTEQDIPSALVWLYWLSPISYSVRAANLVVFYSDTFSQDGRTEIALSAFAIRSEKYWIWAGIAYAVVLTLLCTFGQTLALSCLSFGNEKRNGGNGWATEEEGEEEEEVAAEDREQVALSEETTHLAVDDATSAAEKPHMITALPSAPADLSFERLIYSVRVKGKVKVLVNSINGLAKHGRMCAIIGATGAGKTTTLDLLAGRKTLGTQSGDILVNGHALDRSTYQRLIGYCEQEDNHSSYSTVRESVLFAASLRLPRETGEAKRVVFVDAILDALEMKEEANRKVGVKGKGGLSVGQFKKLTVAVEMAANPAILFLDEPTSGLDSRAAATTMATVKRLCASGRTVLCTIHQPSREVVSLFDDVLLLQKGGRVAYHGAMAGMAMYFSGLEANLLKLPAGEFNPCEYALDVLSGPTKDSEPKNVGLATVRPTEEPVDYATLFDASEQWSQVKAALLELRSSPLPLPALGQRPSQIASSGLVIRRWVVAYWRAPEYNLVRAISMAAIGLLVGATFFQNNKLTSVPSAQSFVGVMFFNNMLCGFLTALTCLNLMFESRKVFSRERNSRSYSVLAYIGGSTVAELPYVFVASLLSTTIFYFLLGMRPGAWPFFVYLCFFYVFSLQTTFLGHLVTSIAPNVPVATIVISSVTSVFALFSGFMVPYDDCPVYFQWIFYLSPTYYCLNGIVSTQLECSCLVDINNASALTPNFTCNGGMDCDQVCPDWPGCEIVVQSTLQGEFHLTVAQFMEIVFGYGQRDWWIDVCAILAFCVAFRLLDMLVLTFKSLHKR